MIERRHRGPCREFPSGKRPRELNGVCGDILDHLKLNLKYDFNSQELNGV